MKKYVAEFIGTAVLTGVGCGTAMLVGCAADAGCGYILTAFAFGLSIVAMAYSIGNISGCHINPAVSLGVLMSGGMSTSEFVGYVVAQVLGAFCGSAVDAVIFGLGGVTDMTGGFGANGLAGVNGSAIAGLVVELVLTFIFVTTILGVTDSKFKHGSFAGLVIGLTLFFVHIFLVGKLRGLRGVHRQRRSAGLALGLHRWPAGRRCACRRCVQVPARGVTPDLNRR